GMLYVKKDGTTLSFCSHKCQRNLLNLGREGRLMRWTNKGVSLVSDKKAPEKKESAVAKEIEAKLAEKKAPAKK
ncbi:MAG: hypothetical protein KGH63_02700, partial [Candidatus Micrarchaeota archaeon]|nr:hypothetical protein [Candidatus Micrarchaeota archaeon]